MTGVPELQATLSVSKLKTAGSVPNAKSVTDENRTTSIRFSQRRKIKNLRDEHDKSITQETSEKQIKGTTIPPIGEEIVKELQIDHPQKPEFREHPKFTVHSMKGNLYPTQDEISVVSKAIEASPRYDVRKRGNADGLEVPATQSGRSVSAPGFRTENDGRNANGNNDDSDEFRSLETNGKDVKDRGISRPRSDSRLSKMRRRKARRRLSTLESRYSEMADTEGNPEGSVNGKELIASGENLESESKIRQIWRKELGLDLRPPRRHFGSKEYITGLAVGIPGQYSSASQQAVTRVVPGKFSIAEIQRRRKVLPPIDKFQKNMEKQNEKPPKPDDPEKDVNALAGRLCRGAYIEEGNSETENAYRVYRDARKDAFFVVDLPPKLTNVKSKYLRTYQTPPTSDDDRDDGFNERGVKEVWKDSSYSRITRIASPDNDGETVITHTVDASKVFDFGGRVVRRTQIDIFLPSDAPGDENASDDEDTDYCRVDNNS